jgi:hypothetical protein
MILKTPNKIITFIIYSYLLTYCMKQSPTWEATQFAASQATQFAASLETPLFYGTRRFITEFTSAHQLSLSWASSI